MCAMDSLQEHPENEDKHLISHLSSLISVTGNRGLSSSDGEYGKQLASVVINNANSPSKIIFFGSMSNIKFLYYFYEPLFWIYFSIIRIHNIYNFNSQCSCTCKCEATCTGNFICLCICNCTEPGTSNGFCVCICKKNSCKCICICICKNGKSCSPKHNCEKCFIKIDIESLKTQTSNIRIYLRWIRCYISRIENKCCLCSCCLFKCCGTSCCTECQTMPCRTCCCCICPKCLCYQQSSSGVCSLIQQCKPCSCKQYCSCKDCQIDHISIISKINLIELLFVQISQKIPELIKLKNILSFLYLITTKCQTCGEVCKGAIKRLTHFIQKATRYYYLFASRINEIGPFVEYKINYKKIQQILYIIEKSISCLLHSNTNIIKDLLTTNRTDNGHRNINLSSYTELPELKKITLLNILSRIVIDESIFVMSRLYTYYKTKNLIDETLKILNRCICLIIYDKNWRDKIETFDKPLPYFSIRNQNPSIISHMIYQVYNHGNYFCLCLVLRYILLKDLYVIIKYNENISMDLLSCMSRSYKKHTYSTISDLNPSKVIMLMVTLMDKIINWLKYIYIGDKMHCFCYDLNNPYYSYLISITIYLSSLTENIWATNNHAIVSAIQSLSNLYSELKIYDFTKKDIRPASCGKVCSLIVNKPCDPKEAKNCCCWCVAFYNVLVSCVSLCVQFRLYKAIHKNNTQLCEKVKKFCEELDCKCTCADKEKCCLLKLALSCQLPNNEELKKLLETWCKECGEGKCCKKILEKVKEGQADLLLIACNCECTTGETEEIKAQCVLFENPWGGRSSAVVIVCKCKQPTKCCCLKEVIEKLKAELTNLCTECKCQDLTKKIESICDKSCCGGENCPCEQLKTLFKKICGQDSQCLCKKIDELANLCAKPDCQCKKAEACCRCVCCKMAIAGVRVLTRACRQNFLEPYKRITLDLISSSTDNHVKRMIVDSINSERQKQAFLVKNNYSTHFNSYTDHKNIANSFPRLTVGYAYDTVYEHETTGNSGYTGINGIRKGYTKSSSGRIIKRKKM